MLFIGACSSSEKKTEDHYIGILGVSIEAEEGSIIGPGITHQHVGSEVGPSPITEADEFSSLNEVRLTPVVALNFSPGLMRSYLHLHTIRLLEAHDIVPTIISGTEMGAVIAVLYSFGVRADMIEWRFMQFLRETEGQRYGSRDWQDNLINVLLADIKDKQIEESLKTLLIPVYDREQRDLVFYRRGSIVELIRAQFRHNGGGESARTISPFPFNAVFSEELKSRGADILIGSNVLMDQINFESPDSFLFGLFGRAASRFDREVQNYDQMIIFNSALYPLDSRDQRQLRGVRPDESFVEQGVNAKKIIEQWDGRRVRSRGAGQSLFDQNFFMGEDSGSESE